MPEIFALQGAGNCGKSTVLVNLYKEIMSKYPAATIQAIHPGTVDIAIIISGVKGLVVGIESQGDPRSRLQNTLANFVAANCDIIFCACRTRGMTVGWVNALSPQYNVRFVKQKIVVNNYVATNIATAVSLMRKARI